MAYERASLPPSARGALRSRGQAEGGCSRRQEPGELEGEEVGQPGLLGLRAEFETRDARGHFVEFS